MDEGSRPGRSASLVAAGILCSRLAGLIRLRVFAHYFGLHSDPADAFYAAFRIPNVLQNLFGEGSLSASFIPVYAGLLARGKREEADRVAGSVAALLSLLVAGVVAAGLLAAPLLVAVIAPGFAGAKRELTVQLVRILFPGAGLLVLSAWCLGVLNSHRRFLLSYTAPVVWNAAMIATLVAFGSSELPRLAVLLAWGSVLGSALQFGVQIPTVLKAAPDLRFAVVAVSGHVRVVASNFIPVLFSRGVVQVSVYIDELLASLLPTGAVTGLANAQLLYTLPVSLFGLSVAAAELPAMSGVVEAEASGAAGQAGREALRARLDAGLRRIAFFVVPSAMAFLALGDVVAAAILQTGRFTRADADYVWAILAGAAIGLLPSTLGRLYSAAYFALRDTRTPLRFAIAHVAVATVLGYILALHAPGWLGVPALWGTAGLTVAAGAGGWTELLLLRSALNRRIGATGLPATLLARLWGCAAAAAAVAWFAKSIAGSWHPILAAAAILVPYGVVYCASTFLLGVPEAAAALDRVPLFRLGQRPGAAGPDP